MPDDRFRLPGSSYEELVKIIRAYAKLKEEATLEEVTKVAAIHPTIVSRNNKFLVGIGVIEGGQKKQITEKGKALAKALEHEMLAEIADNWRQIVLANEFLDKILSAIRIRKGMELSTLHAHVAYSAGLPKNQTVMTGAATVIEIFRVAGLVKEEDGKIVAVPDDGSRVESWAGLRSQPPTSQPLVPTPLSSVGAVSTRIGTGGAAVTIQIQIQCTAADVDGLGPKLQTLLRQLSGPNEPEDSPAGE